MCLPCLQPALTGQPLPCSVPTVQPCWRLSVEPGAGLPLAGRTPRVLRWAVWAAGTRVETVPSVGHGQPGHHPDSPQLPMMSLATCRALPCSHPHRESLRPWLVAPRGARLGLPDGGRPLLCAVVLQVQPTGPRWGQRLQGDASLSLLAALWSRPLCCWFTGSLVPLPHGYVPQWLGPVNLLSQD